jgi:hypothetical protein
VTIVLSVPAIVIMFSILLLLLACTMCGEGMAFQIVCAGYSLEPDVDGSCWQGSVSGPLPFVCLRATRALLFMFCGLFPR